MKKRVLITAIVAIFLMLPMSGCRTVIGIDPGDERPPLINTNEFWDFQPYWDTNSVPNEHWETNGPNIRIIGDENESI